MNSLYTLALSFMLISLAKCSTVRIEVLPESDNELITDEINITCTPKDIPLDTQDILSMELGLKGDDPLATLKGPTLQLGNDTKNNTRVKGNIAKNISESFLQLTMRKPFEDGVNVYYCRMLYQNEYRQHRMGVAYANVSIESNNNTVSVDLLDFVSELENTTYDLEIKRDVDMADFVHLFKKVSNLENTIKEQERQHTAQDAKVSSRIDELLGAAMDQSVENHGIVGKEFSTMLQIVRKLEIQTLQLEMMSKEQERQLKEQDAKASLRIDELKDEEKSRSQIMLEIVNRVYSRIDQVERASMNRSEVLRIFNKGNDKSMFTQFLKKVSDLEENAKDLEETIEEQERQLAAQDAKASSRMDELEARGQTRNEVIQEIIDKGNNKAILDQLRNKVSELEKYTQALEKTIKVQERQLQDQDTRASSRMDQLESTGRTRNGVIQGLVERENTFSAFNVYGTKLYFGTWKKLTFKHFMLNIGYDYNLATGVYTAPKNGFYVFHLSVFAHASNDLLFHLAVNGETVRSIFVRNKEYHDQASVNAIVQLHKGDKVWPIVKDGYKFTNLDDKYTVFSGYLLRLS